MLLACNIPHRQIKAWEILINHTPFGYDCIAVDEVSLNRYYSLLAHYV